MFLPSCTQPMHSTMYDFTSIFWCQMHTAIFSSKKEQQFFLCHTTGRPYLIDVTQLGGRVSAKRWLYSISLHSKISNKGEGSKTSKNGWFLFSAALLFTTKAKKIMGFKKNTYLRQKDSALILCCLHKFLSQNQNPLDLHKYHLQME